MQKWVKKIMVDLNLNLNHKCLSPSWRKSMWFLIYGEAREHSKLARQIYGERLSQKILSNARTFVNVVQHFSDFGCFEMTKRDLGRQREDRILVAQLLVHSSRNLKASLPAVIN
jgi:hypothetical protein